MKYVDVPGCGGLYKAIGQLPIPNHTLYIMVQVLRWMKTFCSRLCNLGFGRYYQ